ncbi:hypothetical protein VNO80_17634 [Phaseolus coccineus]|uniref:Uncharacterized protein n=1 Tax=Phaseolus coccineus TaxID=3886 RepID=A0AAN9MCC0_PHACN
MTAMFCFLFGELLVLGELLRFRTEEKISCYHINYVQKLWLKTVVLKDGYRAVEPSHVLFVNECASKDS